MKSAMLHPEMVRKRVATPERAPDGGSDPARLLGNRLTGRLLQAKLAVGSPNDPLEGEADRMAERVLLSAPDPVTTPSVRPSAATADRVQLKCGECGRDEETGTLRSKEVSGQVPRPAPGVEGYLSSLSGRGETLSKGLRGFFEPRFGFDFAGVRVHIDPEASAVARSLGARAFTVGRDVVFAEGQWQPDTLEGRRLLAHELAHVTQQSHRLLRQVDDEAASEEDSPPPLPRPETRELDYAFFFAGGAYGTAARSFIRRYYPGHRVVAAQSFEEMFDHLYADLRAVAAGQRAHVREIVIVTHANAAGGLRIPLTRGDARRRRFFNLWDLRDLQQEFRQGAHRRFQARRHEVVEEMFDAETRVVVRGCEFGQAGEAMEALRGFFGGQAAVWAPRGYQGYETLRIGGSFLRTPEQAYDFLVAQGYLPPESGTLSDADKRAYIARVFGLHGEIPADFFVMSREAYTGLRAEMAAGRGTRAGAESFKTRGVSDVPSVGEYWNLSAASPLGEDPELDALSIDEIENRARALNNPYRPTHAAMLQRLRRAWERKGLETLTRGDQNDPLAGLPPEGIFGDSNIVAMDAYRYPGPRVMPRDWFETEVVQVPQAADRSRTSDFPEPPAPADAHPGEEPEQHRERVATPEERPPRPAAETDRRGSQSRGDAYAHAIDFRKDAPPPEPPPPQAVEAGPERPRSLDHALDTMDLSGSELEREVQLIEEWLLVHAEDSDATQRLRREMSRLNEEVARRRTFARDSEAFAREGDLAVLLAIVGPGELFLQGFVAGASFEMRPRDLIRFARDMVDPSISYVVGGSGGVIYGIGEDIYNNLEGLAQIAALADPALVPRLVGQEAMDYAADPEGYIRRRERQMRALREMGEGLREFAQAIVRDPRILCIQSQALGQEVGRRAARYFDDRFMATDDMDRGFEAGRVSGIILTEVALLFLGPEEWLERGVAMAGEGTRVAGEAARLTAGAATRLRSAPQGLLRIIEEMPGLRRSLNAVRELEAAESGLRGAEEVGRGLHGAGDLERAGGHGEAPLRGIDGLGQGDGVPRGELSVVPDPHRPPEPPGHVPESQALPVEQAEELPLAAGGEGRVVHGGSDPMAPRAVRGGPRPPPEGGRVIEFPASRSRGTGPRGETGPRGRGRGRGPEAPRAGGRAGSEAVGTTRSLESAAPGSLRAEELFTEAGAFRSVDAAVNPALAADLERLQALHRRYGRRRNPRDWLINTESREARAIMERVLEPNGQAVALVRARRVERMATARTRFPDPSAWSEIEALERRFPEVRDAQLVPMERDMGAPGMVEEALGTNQGAHSFEGVLPDGRRVQIDGFNEAGRLVENKSRSPSDLLERELDILSPEHRDTVLQMERQVEFARQFGLPGVVWQTDNLRYADMLQMMARDMGFQDFVRIIDTSVHP